MYFGLFELYGIDLLITQIILPDTLLKKTTACDSFRYEGAFFYLKF